jgi:hypothetical protein
MEILNNFGADELLKTRSDLIKGLEFEDLPPEIREKIRALGRQITKLTEWETGTGRPKQILDELDLDDQAA